MAEHQKAFCLLWRCSELSKYLQTSHCNKLKLSRMSITNWLFTNPRKVNKPVDNVIWTRQGSLCYLALSPLESFPCYIYSQRQLLAIVSDDQWAREVSLDENIASPTLQLNTKIVINYAAAISTIASIDNLENGLLLCLPLPHSIFNYDDYELQNNAHFQENSEQIFFSLIFLLFESLLLSLAYPTEVAKYSCCCKPPLYASLVKEVRSRSFWFCNRAFSLTQGYTCHHAWSLS